MTNSTSVATRATAHAYPPDLARLVAERWAEVELSAQAEAARAARATSGAPSPQALERLLSVCYQASLLYEESRPVTFRLACAEPEKFSVVEGPPAGLHRLMFERTRPFDEHELSRLAPAAVFERSLIGVHLEDGDELRVWGLIHSGPRWLQAVRGGRHIVQSIPEVLMVAVTGPGRVLVSRGQRTLAGLAGGTLGSVATDVFDAPWFGAVFGRPEPTQRATSSAHAGLAPAPSGLFDQGLPQKLSEHVLRRIVATIRATRHGGTIVILPPDARRVCEDSRCLILKYPFFEEGRAHASRPSRPASCWSSRRSARLRRRRRRRRAGRPTRRTAVHA